ALGGSRGINGPRVRPPTSALESVNWREIGSRCGPTWKPPAGALETGPALTHEYPTAAASPAIAVPATTFRILRRLTTHGFSGADASACRIFLALFCKYFLKSLWSASVTSAFRSRYRATSAPLL